MILHLYSQGASPELILRGQARQLARVIRRAERLGFDYRAVLSQEQDYTASQLAVLNTIADLQQGAFLSDLEAGLIAEPQ